MSLSTGIFLDQGEKHVFEIDWPLADGAILFILLFVAVASIGLVRFLQQKRLGPAKSLDTIAERNS